MASIQKRSARRDFVGDMHEAKGRAQTARNRGRHTGASAKGWDFKRPDPERGTWAYFLECAKIAYRGACSDAAEDYRRAVFEARYGEPWPEEGL